jgi:hypothetical protein
MFCTPGLIFGGTESVDSHFHVLRSRKRVSISCFAHPNSFSPEPRASCPVFIFCATEHGFVDAECVGSRFHILHFGTSFWRYRVRRDPFSCFALPDSFSAVARASDPVFMFSAPEHIFGGAKGVGSCFHVLRSRTRFRRYRGRRIPFSAVPRKSGPVFTFCAPGVIVGGTEGVDTRFHVLCPGLIFGGTEGVGSRFHVLRARTHLQRYRARRVPLSSFALPNSFSAVPWVSDLVFMFCAPGLLSVVSRASGPVFMSSIPGLIFGGIEDAFSAVLRASGPVFMFCTPGLVFGGTEDVGSRIHVLRAWTRFRRYRGHWVTFSCFSILGSRFNVLRSRTHFRSYRGCLVPCSCFALPDMFSAVSSASGPICMFCAPGLIFGGLEVDRSHFQVLRTGTSFWRYQGRRVPFSCFAFPDTFSSVRRASGHVSMFYAPRLVFSENEGAGSHFYVLRFRSRLTWYRGRLVPFSFFAR